MRSPLFLSSTVDESRAVFRHQWLTRAALSIVFTFALCLLPLVERALAERVAEESRVPALRAGRPCGAKGVRARRVGREVQAVGLARARGVDDVATALGRAVARVAARAEHFVVAVAVEV